MFATPYYAPTSGSWDNGRFYSFIPRFDGYSSGVVMRRDFGGHVLIEQNARIYAAKDVAELLTIPGAMTIEAYFALIGG